MENLFFPSLGGLSYPVGDNIKAANKFAKAASCIFNKIRELNARDVYYLNIWCRGSSGAILASLFSINLVIDNVKIIHIKKPGENSHDGEYSPYEYRAVNVIIDDFISSGQTLNHIYSQMGALNISIVDVLVIQRLGYLSIEDIRNQVGFLPRYLISDF